MHVRFDRHHRHGFTVLELLIIVMILGLMSAIGIPRFASTLDAVTLRTQAAALRAHLTHARRTAISTGRPTTVAFQPLTRTYFSSTVDFPDRPGQLINVDLAESLSPQVQLLANFDGYATITFGIDGIPQTSGGALSSGVITLTLDERSVQIVIGVDTGTVTTSDLTLLTPTATDVLIADDDAFSIARVVGPPTRQTAPAKEFA